MNNQDLTVRSDSKMVSADTWTTLMSQATELLKSGFLPTSIKTPAQAIAIILTGRELGIGIMQSLRQIHVIENKPSIPPELMLSLIYNSGQAENITINSQETFCEVAMIRKGMSEIKVKFTTEDAQKLGLLYRDNWKRQQKNMLRWRCVAACARLAFPDITAGLYTPEELENSDDVVGKDVAILELSEKLNTDPDAYTKWCEVTTTTILEETATCETDTGLSQIRRKHEKEIGQMMDDDRAYVTESFENRLQQIVSDSTPKESILKDTAIEAEIAPEKPLSATRKATPEEVLDAQEKHSQEFGHQAVNDINNCKTKAALNVLKASAKFIEGRAKCNMVMKEYVDAVLKNKYGSLEGK